MKAFHWSISFIIVCTVLFAKGYKSSVAAKRTLSISTIAQLPKTTPQNKKSNVVEKKQPLRLVATNNGVGNPRCKTIVLD